MRWNNKPKPKVGDTRIIERYLWLPKCINNEWRFFERVKYEQIYENSWDESYWTSTRWLN
jgi:hypothetical protein